MSLRSGRTYLLFALLLVLVAACGSKDGTTADNSDGSQAIEDSTVQLPAQGEESSEAESTSAQPVSTTVAPNGASEAPAPIDTAPLDGSEMAAIGEVTNWTGVIGDGIGISLWVAQNDDFLRGEISYDTVGEPIMVLGRAAYLNSGGNGYFLHEFAPDGRVTGTLSLGTVTNGVVSDATWDDLPLSLSFTGVSNDPFFFDPLVRSGVYSYAFAPFGDGDELCCGATGNLHISAVTPSALTISVENVNSGPGFNLAFIEPTQIPLKNNVARFERKDIDFIDCAFDVTVYDGYAYVQYVDDRFECGFGNSAGVEGIYPRTAEVIETADSQFTGSALTSTTFGEVSLGETWQSLTERFGVDPYRASQDDFFDGCYYVQIPNDAQSPWFMLLGDGDDAVVSRIEPSDGSHKTDTGLGVGNTEADVDAEYGDAVTKTPHQYEGDGAKYLLIDDGPEAESAIMFETDAQGVITSIRNGYNDAIRWVEGCA